MDQSSTSNNKGSESASSSSTDYSGKNQQEHYELAVKFLSNPKIYGLPDEKKIDFLLKKGLNRVAIEAALDHVQTTQNSNSTGNQIAAPSPKPGLFGFIWKIVKYSSGLFFGAFLFRQLALPYLRKYLAFLDSDGSFDARRTAAGRRRDLQQQHVGDDNNATDLKKLDVIVANLQTISESLNQLLNNHRGNRPDDENASSGGNNNASYDKVLAEIADLKAMLVSPNRFPPMPSSTYVPSGSSANNNNKSHNSRNSNQHQKHSSSTSAKNQQQQPESNNSDGTSPAPIQSSTSNNGTTSD